MKTNDPEDIASALCQMLLAMPSKEDRRAEMANVKRVNRGLYKEVSRKFKRLRKQLFS